MKWAKIHDPELPHLAIGFEDINPKIILFSKDEMGSLYALRTFITKSYYFPKMKWAPIGFEDITTKITLFSRNEMGSL